MIPSRSAQVRKTGLRNRFPGSRCFIDRTVTGLNASRVIEPPFAAAAMISPMSSLGSGPGRYLRSVSMRGVDGFSWVSPRLSVSALSAQQPRCLRLFGFWLLRCRLRVVVAGSKPFGVQAQGPTSRRPEVYVFIAYMHAHKIHDENAPRAPARFTRSIDFLLADRISSWTLSLQEVANKKHGGRTRSFVHLGKSILDSS